MKKYLFLTAIALVVALGSCVNKPSSSEIVDDTDSLIQTEDTMVVESAAVDTVVEAAPEA